MDNHPILVLGFPRQATKIFDSTARQCCIAWCRHPFAMRRIGGTFRWATHQADQHFDSTFFGSSGHSHPCAIASPKMWHPSYHCQECTCLWGYVVPFTSTALSHLVAKGLDAPKLQIAKTKMLGIWNLKFWFGRHLFRISCCDPLASIHSQSC